MSSSAAPAQLTPPPPQFPPEYADYIASNTEKSLDEILKAIKISSYELSPVKVQELAECLLKDLRRLAIAQRDEISDTKYAAYWAFWVRKIKPIRVAWRDAEKTIEVPDINERAALELAIATVKQAGKHNACQVRAGCSASCDGAACVERYLGGYFAVNQNYYSEYLIYSMAKRTFGPHHLCAVLDAILFAACAQPAGLSGRYEPMALAATA
ncbi:MAG TPA: hypothetical protein VHU18_03430 [Rhizomicrobium sp.]|jgi:hypothetical protein|nr:hypothetical protein [Rhizomicrobium sp.]